LQNINVIKTLNDSEAKLLRGIDDVRTYLTSWIY